MIMETLTTDAGCESARVGEAVTCSMGLMRPSHSLSPVELEQRPLSCRHLKHLHTFGDISAPLLQLYSWRSRLIVPARPNAGKDPNRSADGRAHLAVLPHL